MEHAKILHFDDERDLGNGIIVTTARGFAFEPHSDERIALHVKGFDKPAEVKAELKWVKPCTCARCRGGD